MFSAYLNTNVLSIGSLVFASLTWLLLQLKHRLNNKKSGSLALPFETVLDKVGQADFWIFGYYGNFNKQQLLAEYPGYAALKPFKTDEIYGCQIDRTPYFEEVSWRPDWLLADLVQLFHPDLRTTSLRYYHRL